MAVKQVEGLPFQNLTHFDVPAEQLLRMIMEARIPITVSCSELSSSQNKKLKSLKYHIQKYEIPMNPNSIPITFEVIGMRK